MWTGGHIKLWIYQRFMQIEEMSSTKIQCTDSWTLTGAWTSRSDKLNDCQLGWQNMQRLQDTVLGQIWYTYSLVAIK